jgi:hypothetical protein
MGHPAFSGIPAKPDENGQMRAVIFCPLTVFSAGSKRQLDRDLPLRDYGLSQKWLAIVQQ